MAVFTKLTDRDSTEIATFYRLGTLRSIIGIADGDTESTYLFRCAQGQYIVTLFETGAEPDDVERAFRTMERLVAAGVPCPATLRTEPGAATVVVSGKLVAVVGFVPGVRASAITAQKCHALGRVCAQIHVTLQSTARVEGGTPRGAVHGALTRDNVFFIGDSVSGVINFRLRHDDVLVSELASVMVLWAMHEAGHLNLTLAGSLLAGYAGVRPLSGAERGALPDFVSKAAAIRFGHSADAEDLNRVQLAGDAARTLVGRMKDLEAGP